MQKLASMQPHEPGANYLAKCRAGMGATRLANLANQLQSRFAFNNKKGKQWVPNTIKSKDGPFEFAQMQLKVSKHYLNVGKEYLHARFKDELPEIELLYENMDSEGNNCTGSVIGACAKDPVNVFKLVAVLCLGREKYHQYFQPICARNLPIDHIDLVYGHGDDGLPFNTMHLNGMVQGSVFLSNMLGASNAPEMQLNWMLGSFGEGASQMTYCRKKLDKAFEVLEASRPAESSGIAIELRSIPTNAKYSHSGTVGKPHTLYLHARRTFHHADEKTPSECFVRDPSAASKAMGGLRVKGLGRGNVLMPEVPITLGSTDDLSWMTWEWIEKMVAARNEKFAELQAHVPKYAESTLHTKINEFCVDEGHPFTSGELPFKFAEVGFADPLHIDTIEGKVQVDSGDDICKQFDVQHEFHDGLCGAHAKKGFGLSGVGHALKAKEKGEKEGAKFRLAGDDRLDWGEQAYSLLRQAWASVVCADGRFWFESMALLARIHIHRAMSSLYSRHKMRIEWVGALISMGNDMQRLLYHSGGKAALTAAYITKVNPYLPKLLMEDLRLDDEWVLGLGALAGWQGTERLHAFLKMFFSLSDQRARGLSPGVLALQICHRRRWRVR